MACRQIFEIDLCAMKKAFARDAAGARRDLRLQNLIPRALRSTGGVEKDLDALFLKWLQEMPPHERADCAAGDGDQPIFRAHAAEEHRHSDEREKARCRTER